MTRIPFSALILGLAGLIPFLWGAVTAVAPGLEDWSQSAFGFRFTSGPLLQTYGIVILSFMSGVIWGFATRAKGATAALGYALSVLPALWAFFLGTGMRPMSLWALLVGFVALLAVDALFTRRGLAPDWWMSLRLLLTGIVAACLAIGALA